MVYSAYVCETVSGKLLAPLDCSISSWKRELTGTDTASVVLAPGALTVATRDLYRLNTLGGRSTLVIEWSNPGDPTGTPVFAGPIWTRQWDGKQLTINASGIRSILAKRKLINWTAPYQSQSLTFSGMSLGSIAVKVVQTVTAQAGESLPILFPSIETDTDPTHTATYAGYNLKDADSALTDLTNLVNGPEIDFTPAWVDANRSAIMYVMRVGTDEQPRLLSTYQLAFDAAQPGSSVQLLTYLDDASIVSTRQWGNGSGTDVDTLMSTASSAALVNAGYPVLEQETDYKSETVQTNLDKAVQGDLALASSPTVQWGLTIDATAPPQVGSYLPGDLCRVRVAGHVWIPDGDYPMRIVSIAGNSSTAVVLSVQGA